MRLATELMNFIKAGQLLRHEIAKHEKHFNKEGYDIIR